MAYQSAYPKTTVGKIEIKDIPASLVMEASGQENATYFKDRGSGSSFMKLFRYIQSNNMPMTTPVEVNVNANTMRFYADSETRDMKNTSDVNAMHLPARKVLSIGIRGSYNQENYDKGTQKLKQWLSKQSDFTAINEPYAVFWDSPYVPFFLKHGEVHIPVKVTLSDL